MCPFSTARAIWKKDSNGTLQPYHKPQGIISEACKVELQSE